MKNYKEYLEQSALAVADAPGKMDITVQLFIQTPVWIQKRKELTAIDKDVYGIIYTFIKNSMLDPDPEERREHCWPSLNRIADDAGASKSSVATSLKKLDRLRLIGRRQMKGVKGINLPTVYYLLKHPWAKKKLLVSESDKGSIETGQGLSGFRTQIDNTIGYIKEDKSSTSIVTTACNGSIVHEEDSQTPQADVTTDESLLVQVLNEETGQDLLRRLEPGGEREEIIQRLKTIIEVCGGPEFAHAAIGEAMHHKRMSGGDFPTTARHAVFVVEQHVGIYADDRPRPDEEDTAR